MNSASRHSVLEEPPVSLGIKRHAIEPRDGFNHGFDADCPAEIVVDAGFSGIFTLVSRPVAAMGGVLFRANTAGECAMHKSMQLRWIEQAEGKSVREHVGLQRAASEPHIGIACTTTGPAWSIGCGSCFRYFAA